MINKNPKTVSELLREVDYDFPDYIPSKEVLLFLNFIKLVNNGDMENVNPIVHMKLLEAVFNDTYQTAVLSHRGIAKSTLFAEYLTLFIAVYGYIPNFGKVTFMIYVADSLDNNVKMTMRGLKNKYENSPYLQKHFDKAIFNQYECEFTRKDTTKDNSIPVKNRKFLIRGYGAQTGVRGARYNDKRPEFALLDDLIKDAREANSELVLNSIEDTIKAGVRPALHPTEGKITWLGTPFNQRDPLYRAVESGAWTPAVYPVCENIYEGMPKEEFKGSWEDRFTYESVMRSYNIAKAEGNSAMSKFMQEMMLQIVSEDEKLITENQLKWFDRNDLIERIHNFNIYITTDLATSTSKSSDYRAICVWAYSNNNDWFLIDGCINKDELNENIDNIFRYVTKYKPLSVGIEVTGQQEGFISWINQEMIRRNVFFNLASEGNSNRAGIRPTNNKFVRFLTIVPLFSQGKIYLPRQWEKNPLITEFVEEVTMINQSSFLSKHDDVIDCVSMLQFMKAIAPSTDSYAPKYNERTRMFDMEMSEEMNVYGGGSYLC